MKVAWFGHKTNLHAVWDEMILSKWAPDWMEAMDLLEQMMENDPSIITEALQTMDPLDWADESFDMLASVYDFSDCQAKDGGLKNNLNENHVPLC